MSESVQNQIKNHDLAGTIIYWLRDFFEASAEKWRLTDCDNIRSFELSRAEGGTSRLKISSSFLFLHPGKLEEFFRKAAVKVHLTHDYRSMDHFRAVSQIFNLRDAVSRFMNKKNESFPEKFLLRIDDFPSLSRPSEDFLKCHEELSRAGIPYLLAVTPFLKHADGSAYLTDREIQILRKCAREGAEIALHGFSHESRSLENKSELLEMPAAELSGSLDKALAYLKKINLEPVAFVAPFNSYDSRTLPVLAGRFPVLCGGPESVDSVGYRLGPSFLHGSLYVPSYRGVYDVSALAQNVSSAAPHLPVPVSIHWVNRKDTSTLIDQLKNRTISWSQLTAFSDVLTRRL